MPGENIMSTESKRMDNVEQALDIKKVEAQMEENHKLLESFIEKSNKEIEANGKAATETKAAIDELSKKGIEIGDRLQALEQKQEENIEGAIEPKTPGDMLVEAKEFESMVANINRFDRGSCTVDVKTAIVNAVPSMTQPLTAGHRLDTVVREPNRALRIRDLFPAGRTDSNIVWFPKENVFTNAAAVQVGGSPTIVAENVALGESALTFTSDSEEVKTIGHWIPVSKQALADSNFLRGYVNERLLYGLGLKVDTELLTGAGTLGTITGCYTDRTAYSMDSPLSYTTKLDVLRDAKAQAAASNYDSEWVILNPQDFADIELQKETAGMYIYANPASTVPMSIWGMRVVLSNSMTAGTFLVGSSRCAQVWTREQAAVSISYENGTDFVEEMATMKAVERLAFTIYNKAGLIGGSFTVT